MYYEMKYDSPVGRLTMASDGSNLAGLWMEGQKYFGGTVTGELHPCGELPVFSRTKDWLDRYFSGKRPEDVYKRQPNRSPAGIVQYWIAFRTENTLPWSSRGRCV